MTLNLQVVSGLGFIALGVHGLEGSGRLGVIVVQGLSLFCIPPSPLVFLNLRAAVEGFGFRVQGFRSRALT